MAIVFVHGVDTREGDSYTTDVAVKRKFLDEALGPVLIDGKPIGRCLDGRAGFPYWGELGAVFHWQMQSLPPPATRESLGASEEIGAFGEALAVWGSVAPQTMDAIESLTQLAKQRSLRHAVAVLNAAIREGSSDPVGAAEFIVAASRYAQANEDPPWLGDVKTDAVFIDRLLQHVALAAAPGESLGASSAIANLVNKSADRVKRAARAVAKTAVDRGGDVLSARLLASRRAGLNAKLGRFFGDVFCYFSGRGKVDAAGPIPRLIGEALQRARDAEVPLVVVAHSLGGVISFDVLSSFFPIEVDLFITVGSQVSHFEELKLYNSSDPDVPNDQFPHAAKPANIQRWLNVYDRVDIFSYACARVFDGVEDIDYDTETHVVSAHSAYFEQARFYDRVVQTIQRR